MFANVSGDFIANGVARIYSMSERYQSGATYLGRFYRDPANDVSLEKGYEYTAAFDEATGFLLRYRRPVADVDPDTLEIITPPGDWALHGNMSKEAAQRELAAIRYSRETGGLALPNGSRIHTDRGSQAQLASAYQSLTQPFVSSIDWKGPDGWANVTEVELRPIAEAVAQHVQGCFTAERRVSEQQIAAASAVDDLVAIDLEAAFAAELEAVKTSGAA